MKPSEIIGKLEENAIVFEKLCEELEPEEYKWKSNPDSWSVLEIICHLRDEEIEDFRTRIRCIISDPPKEPPPFNPESWVEERKYSEQSFKDMLASFLRQREGSVLWLHSLDREDWNKTFEHPTRGSLTSYFYLENWLAHDYLHIRQIVKVNYDFLKSKAGNDLSYAGIWK